MLAKGRFPLLSRLDPTLQSSPLPPLPSIVVVTQLLRRWREAPSPRLFTPLPFPPPPPPPPKPPSLPAHCTYAFPSFPPPPFSLLHLNGQLIPFTSSSLLSLPRQPPLFLIFSLPPRPRFAVNKSQPQTRTIFPKVWKLSPLFPFCSPLTHRKNVSSSRLSRKLIETFFHEKPDYAWEGEDRAGEIPFISPPDIVGTCLLLRK